MLARLRSFLIKTPVKVVFGLFVAWLLFGWFAFGPLAKWGAEKYVLSKSGHHLVMDTPRFDPLGLKLTLDNVRLTEPDGKLLAGFKEFFVDFEASSLFHFAWTFDTIRLVQPEGNLALLPGGTLNWAPFIAAFKSEDDNKDSNMPRLLIRHFELKNGQLDFADQTVQPTFETAFKPLELSLDDLSTLPDDKGAYQISARTPLGARLRWKGNVELKPVMVTGALALEDVHLAQLEPYLKGHANIAPPAGLLGVSTNYRLTYDKKQLGLTLDQLGLTLDGLKLRGLQETEPALSVDHFAVQGGHFDLASRKLDLGEIGLAGGQVNLTRQANGRLNVQDWLPASTAAAPTTSAVKPAPSAPWQIGLGKFDLDKVAIQFRDQTFATPLNATLADLHIGFKADAQIGGSETQAHLIDAGIHSGKLVVATGSAPLLELGGIRVEGATADLAKRMAGVQLIALDQGRLNAVRNADGTLPLLAAFKPGKPTTASDKKSGSSQPAANEPGWSWTLDQAQLNGFEVAAQDQSLKPAAHLTLQNIDASVSGLSQDMKAAVPVKLALQVKEGGKFNLQGKLVPAEGSLDAQLDLAGLNLTPAQPYVAQAANLALVSGRAGSKGQLKIGKRIGYQGSFRIDNLLVKESLTGDRLLAWRGLSTANFKAAPDALNIGEIKLDGLGAKLVIYKDKSTNVQAALKPQPAVASKNAPPVPAKGKPGFRLAIDRVNVTGSEMDFADESLTLPFGTRIHGLKGYIDGITSQAGTPAQIELDGLVDDYGLARAVGQMDFLDPTGYTDVKVLFKNVEMNRLTPYSATFAGRKINSGKLSLNLDYKIKDRQLQGENQVIMDKLTLGERVASPTAKDLPLDLAIAILEDSDGRIDLGLPVSGSLDDPQFSYGQIVWKAIFNLIGKVALAPFRALGSLFGGSGDKLGDVTFDAGEPGLLPPEKEKLKQVVQVLAKRPKLALTVQGGWSPEVDGLAIRERQLRRALAETMGRKLGPNEDPGPVTLAQSKTQDGLEKLYATRFGADTLKTFKAKFAQVNPAPPPTSASGRLLSRFSGLLKGKEIPVTAEQATQLKGADLHELLYQQLLAKESTTEASLVALGKARGEAMLAELTADGAPAGRLQSKPPAALANPTGQNVAIKLILGVASQPSAVPVPQSGQ
jgi:hypothetical protein